MNPNKLSVPAVVHRKSDDQDVVVLRDADGKRRTIYLGKHGSAAAARRYREVVADLLAGKPLTAGGPRGAPGSWPPVAQLVLTFLQHAETYYRDADGNRSREIDNFALAVAPLLKLYRDVTTDRVGARELGIVRQDLVDTEFGHKRDKKTKEIIEGTGKKHTRTYVNSCMRRIRQVLRWGTEQRLVPPAIWHEVSAMRGLGVGRGGAREPEPVEAVPWPMVEPILPHLPAPLRATVLLQWESGARPTEILQLRTGDIDRSGDVWFYTPEKHKGQWRGQDRVIGFNTAAQDILRPLLKADPKAFLISPRDAIVELKARKRANRQTPLTPSQRARDERNARKAPQVGEFYDVNTYRRAIHRACDEADVPRWSPHRLRHAAGTRACLQGGEEATSVMLGHRDRRMAARYSVAAKRTRLADVLRRLG